MEKELEILNKFLSISSDRDKFIIEEIEETNNLANKILFECFAKFLGYEYFGEPLDSEYRAGWFLKRTLKSNFNYKSASGVGYNYLARSYRHLNFLEYGNLYHVFKELMIKFPESKDELMLVFFSNSSVKEKAVYIWNEINKKQDGLQRSLES